MKKIWVFVKILSILSLACIILFPTNTTAYNGTDEGPFFQEVANIETMVPTNSGERLNGGEAVAILDVNDDGLSDIVIANGTPYYYVVTTLSGAGPYDYDVNRFYVEEGATETYNYIIKALATHDFNKDGLMDLYFPTPDSGTASLKRNIANRRLWSNPPTSGQIQPGPWRPGSMYRTQFSNGDGTFTYSDIGLNGGGMTRVALFADFNLDGWDDAYLSNAPYYGAFWAGSSTPNFLIKGSDQGFSENLIDTMVVNDDSLFFEELCDISGSYCERLANMDFKGVTVRDFDGDGKPDIIACAYSDIWDGRMFLPIATTFPESAEWDLDFDGVPEGGYQGDWARGILVLQNVSKHGQIAFKNVSNDAIENAWGFSDQMHCYVALPADIDGDGDFDLLVTGPRDFTAHNSIKYNTDIMRVYRNDSTPGKIKFTDITSEAGVDFMNNYETMPEPYTGGLVAEDVLAPGVVEGTTDVVAAPRLSAGAAIDIDNDGNVDWVLIDRQFTSTVSEFENIKTTLMGGYVEPEGEFTLWVFLNDGTGKFTYIDPETHNLVSTARDLSYGDFNGDGRLDLVTVNGSGGGQSVEDNNLVYFNNIDNDYGYVRFKVKYGEDHFGIGTTVTVFENFTKKILGHDEIRTDFGYRSRREPIVHAGTNMAELVDVRLVFADGLKIRINGLPVNDSYKISYDETAGITIENAAGDEINNYPFPRYKNRYLLFYDMRGDNK